MRLAPLTPAPLSTDGVLVWRVDIDDASDVAAAYAACLTPEEHVRAERFRAGQVRERFLFGRSCLRILLGQELGMEPPGVPIKYGSHGKPEVAGGGIWFNVAHSRGTILIALSRRGAVGVDIEHTDRHTDDMAVALHSFAPSEIAKLARLTDAEERRHAFFRCWTRKEAVVKADGRGLYLALSSFEVPLDDQTGGRVNVPVQVPAGERGRTFYVSDLTVGAGAVAALAGESSNPEVTILAFPLKLS